ncbi:hypothetical protein HUJ05_003877 [Dendroctonus ponderosae]|nr:hypothetical protein HUJ05_003877 [Dendroctonus ponderosae]
MTETKNCCYQISEEAKVSISRSLFIKGDDPEFSINISLAFAVIHEIGFERWFALQQATTEDASHSCWRNVRNILFTTTIINS